MKKGFTLVELLVVVGIMGMLAMVSIGGYSAVTRGMAERGALDAAAGIAQIAHQRAQIDRTKTYLYLFNEVTRLDSDDQAGVACGVAIAVRPIGRFSRVSGNVYCDEFADLHQSYAALEESGTGASAGNLQNATTIRIYKPASQSYATVQEGVFLDEGPVLDLEGDPANSEDANSEKQPVGRMVPAYGFKQVGGDSFAVGDEYGQEFAVMRLPPGYVFSSAVTLSSSSDLGLKQVRVETINPGNNNPPSIEVFSRRPDGSFKSIGNTLQTKDLKQQ